MLHSLGQVWIRCRLFKTRAQGTPQFCSSFAVDRLTATAQPRASSDARAGVGLILSHTQSEARP